MQALDNDFFELYKRLDNCCRDIYSSRNGVSEYIVQMEQYTSGKYRVYAWDEDYKMLKHLRWIRNQIAHDSRGFSFCQPQDIKALQNFYNRLLSGQDPLALLRKSMKSETQKKEQKTNSVPKIRPKKNSISTDIAFTVIIVGLIAAVAFLALYFSSRYFYNF